MGNFRIIFSLFLTVNLSYCLQYKKKLNTISGVLSTPNYSENYPPDTDYEWEIARQPGMECVVFTVEDFDIPNVDEALCPGDHFSLDSCGSWLDISPEKYICGRRSSALDGGGATLVQHYQLNATSLTVSFHSDSHDEGKGFLMQFQQYDADICAVRYDGPFFSSYRDSRGYKRQCAATLSGSVGSFRTPNFPKQPYPLNLGCIYAIKRPGPEYCGVFLKTAKFDLEPRDGYGCYDYFSASGCRKTCGNGKHIWSFEYQPGADAMILQFNSDYDTPGRGFNIDYVQLKDCFNPYQAECPNDHLVRNTTPSECSIGDENECASNVDCGFGKICCYNGCNRVCTAPVNNKTVKRHTRELHGLSNWQPRK